MTTSQLFRPFRVVGEISRNLNPVCVHHRTETFVTSSVGKAFHTYNAAHLNLLFVSTLHPKNITAMTAGQKLTYTAVGNELRSWKRGKTRSTWKQASNAEVYLLVSFAEDFLLAFSDDNKLTMWTTGEPPAQQLCLDLHDRVTCAVHPHTYLNKILLGFEDGTMQLWNLKSGELVYSFKGWGSAVRCIEQSPALDVAAIGLHDGRIFLHNLKFDETVVSFTQKDVVTALAFRTDGHAIMASANMHGQVNLWHLERKKLITVLKDIHDGPVLSLRFFPGEPVLLTSGNDNSLKMWLFEWTESETGAATHRLLRSRSGHAKPPHYVRFYSHSELLSASTDRSLRMTSIIQDQQSRELTQGHVASRAKKLHLKTEELKLPPIVQFDANPAKERDWDNVVTCHEMDNMACTWSYEKKARGAHMMTSPSGDKTPIMSVAISVCGNFCFTGSESGLIEKYNMQSGIHRGTSTGHQGSVVGLQCDGRNRFYFSASLDKSVRIWDFASCASVGQISTEVAISRILLHRDNMLLAVVLDDLSIVVYDMDTQTVVRRLIGSTDRITDVCFTPDSRWLLASCADGSFRVWDLPTGHLIDVFHVKKAVSSMSFSPLGDFLATTHAGTRGISLWANQAFFSTVFLKSVGEEGAPTLELPTEPVDGAIPSEPSERTNKALFPQLLTLTKVDASRINAIVNIEVIKERNRPSQPPAAPQLAPFFLPTTADSSEQTRPSFVLSLMEEAAGGEQNKQKRSRILTAGIEREKSVVRKLLEAADASADYTKVVEYFASLPPSKIDLEIRMLDLTDDFVELRMMMKFLCNTLKTRSSMELAQALLSVFLKAQGEVLVANKELLPALEELRESAKDEWTRLQAMFHHSLCMLSSTSGIQDVLVSLVYWLPGGDRAFQVSTSGFVPAYWGVFTRERCEMAFFFRRPAVPMRGAVPRRYMSGNDDPKVIDAGIKMWRQASIVGTALCLVWTAWELSHHHEEHAPSKTAASVHIRRKPLPWGDGQTDMFDFFAGKSSTDAHHGQSSHH